MPIEPHGGELVNRVVSGAALKDAQERAKKLPQLTISSFTAFDVDAIARGVLSPLRGFMNEEQTRSVLDKMQLRPGVAWTIPILLPVSQAEADKLKVGQEVALVDDTGDIINAGGVDKVFTYVAYANLLNIDANKAITTFGYIGDWTE